MKAPVSVPSRTPRAQDPLDGGKMLEESELREPDCQGEGEILRGFRLNRGGLLTGVLGGEGNGRHNSRSQQEFDRCRQALLKLQVRNPASLKLENL